MKLKTLPPIKIDFNSENLHLKDHVSIFPGKYKLVHRRPCLKLKGFLYNCHDDILKGYQQSSEDRTISLNFETYPRMTTKNNQFEFDIKIDNRGMATSLFHDYPGKIIDQVMLKIEGYANLSWTEMDASLQLHIDQVLNTYSSAQLKLGDFTITGVENEG